MNQERAFHLGLILRSISLDRSRIASFQIDIRTLSISVRMYLYLTGKSQNSTAAFEWQVWLHTAILSAIDR